jgi:hypothetical protein
VAATAIEHQITLPEDATPTAPMSEFKDPATPTVLRFDDVDLNVSGHGCTLSFRFTA